jgi:hypothetical protein
MTRDSVDDELNRTRREGAPATLLPYRPPTLDVVGAIKSRTMLGGSL